MNSARGTGQKKKEKKKKKGKTLDMDTGRGIQDYLPFHGDILQKPSLVSNLQ